MKPFLLLLIVLTSLHSPFAQYQTKNGFDLSQSRIPANEIKSGGPPKDGIPSIDQPVFLKAGESDLEAQERIIGVYENGVAKAYPIKILNYHEIVNDEYDGKPVVVTYCPLCGSGIAFDSKFDGKSLEFGVSGLLYNRFKTQIIG